MKKIFTQQDISQNQVVWDIYNQFLNISAVPILWDILRFSYFFLFKYFEWSSNLMQECDIRTRNLQQWYITFIQISTTMRYWILVKYLIKFTIMRYNIRVKSNKNYKMLDVGCYNLTTLIPYNFNTLQTYNLLTLQPLLHPSYPTSTTLQSDNLTT